MGGWRRGRLVRRVPGWRGGVSFGGGRGGGGEGWGG
jgi:hypothetical protein